MRITTVHCRKLVTMEGYNNHTVEAAATVEEGEDPQTVLENLTVWVDDRINHERNQRQLVRRGESLAQRIGYLEREHKRLEKIIEESNAIIDQHAVLRELAIKEKLEIPGINTLGDNLPF